MRWAALPAPATPPVRSGPGRPTGPLTSREHQIADLVAAGLTNRQIAAKLVVAPRTAGAHVEHIRRKLGFTSRTQIATWVATQDPNR